MVSAVVRSTVGVSSSVLMMVWRMLKGKHTANEELDRSLVQSGEPYSRLNLTRLE